MGREVVGHHVDRQVAHHLRGGGDFDDVAQQLVHDGVHPLQLGQTVADAHRLGLRAEVAVLAAGDLVQVDVRRGRAQVGLERRVLLADGAPVVGVRHQLIEVEAGIARLALEGGDQRLQARLRGEPGHRGDRRVDDIHPGLRREQQRGDLPARRVVGVEVDRDAHFLPQRLHQSPRRERPAEAGHVLDRQQVGARSPSSSLARST